MVFKEIHTSLHEQAVEMLGDSKVNVVIKEKSGEIFQILLQSKPLFLLAALR